MVRVDRVDGQKNAGGGIKRREAHKEKGEESMFVSQNETGDEVTRDGKREREKQYKRK